MDKSPDAYRTISEVAEELALPQHVLRFWETRFPQIKPLKRGGGRRFYRPDDIDLVRGIKTLLYSEGYTIKGVQRILKDEGVKPVQMIGRGSPVFQNRDFEDEGEDEVSTSDEMDRLESEFAMAPSRAIPDIAAKQNVFGQNDSGTTLSADFGLDHASNLALHAEPKKLKSGSSDMQNASRVETLRMVLRELEECARLVAIAREKYS